MSWVNMWKLGALMSVLGMALVVGAYKVGKRAGVTRVNVNVLQAEVRDAAVLEQTRRLFIWYTACPPRQHGLRQPPKVMMVYPASIRFATDLNAAKYELSGDSLIVRLAPIMIDVPHPGPFGRLGEGGILRQPASPYILAEIDRSVPLVRYLALQTLKAELDQVRASLADRLTNALARVSLGQGATLPSRIAIEWAGSQNDVLSQFQVEEPPFGLKGCEGETDWLTVDGVPFKFTQLDPASTTIEEAYVDDASEHGEPYQEVAVVVTMPSVTSGEAKK